MDKYDALTKYLMNQPSGTNDIVLTFEDMTDADVIGIVLPDSAKTHRQWWENQSSPNGRQCRAWLDAGWEVASVDFAAEQVTFRRQANSN